MLIMWILAIIAAAITSAVGFLLWRPMETARAFLHWRLLLAGARSKFLQTTAARLHYYQIGPSTCPPVIFLTGLGGTGADWLGCMRDLSRAHRGYAVELAGQGRTELADQESPYYLDLQVELLRQFLDAKEIAKIQLVGISLGGWIACRFALKYPERVSRLVVISCAGLRGDLTMEDMRPQNRREARRFIDRLLARDRWVPAPILDDFIRRLNSPRNCRTLSSLREEDFLDGSLDRIALPVDIIWGEGDELFRLEDGRRFHSAIPGSRLHLIAGCGHVPMFEKPRQFRKLLQEILTDCSLRDTQTTSRRW